MRRRKPHSSGIRKRRRKTTRCNILDRTKEMLIRGGENIFPREIEEFPMTVTGKVQKFIMREQMIEELGPAVEKTT